ncbi:NlpC/P60 family protein [Lentibacillus sp. N15]|uniref:C40 family peptidase n=1 Tax=Lentibacillus songyuanensis TaxID=3136161 RepID=UPI0031BAF926
MLNVLPEQVIKQSVLYGFVLSQPLAVYVDAYPVLQNKLLIEAGSVQYGEHGETVRVVQQKLNLLAYYDDRLDGDYGILTEHAIKMFQHDNHVPVTGQTDIQTIHTLIEAEKAMYMKEIKQLSGAIYPGQHNDDVKIVQHALHYFGYYEGELDGIYGPLTKRALETAEQELGIELTNKVTKHSLTTLYEQANEDKSAIQEKSKHQPTPEKHSTTKRKTDKNENEVKHVNVKNTNNQEVVQTAKAYIGTPYVWGGETPDGFDCSGFIQYVYNTQDITAPRTVSDMWNFAASVDRPSVGDLVFFETYKPGPSHMGIYLGDGKFIHAGESHGVEISEMGNPYWEGKYIGAKRIM